MGYFWTGAIILFFAVEVMTYQLVSIWFGVGSVAGLIAYLAGFDFGVQIISFIIVSALALILTRPFVNRMLKNKGEKTNTDRMIGRKIVLTKPVDSMGLKGETVVGGVSWTVNSADGEPISEGETVTVEAIEGVRLIVRK